MGHHHNSWLVTALANLTPYSLLDALILKLDYG